MPLANTKDKPRIAVKIAACSLMLLMAVSATIFKTLIMVHINGAYWVTFPNLSTKMVQFFGLDPDQSLLIIFIDVE